MDFARADRSQAPGLYGRPPEFPGFPGAPPGMGMFPPMIRRFYFRF